MPEYEKAMCPEDITRLFVERSNAGDAAGVAEPSWRILAACLLITGGAVLAAKSMLFAPKR